MKSVNSHLKANICLSLFGACSSAPAWSLTAFYWVSGHFQEQGQICLPVPVLLSFAIQLASTISYFCFHAYSCLLPANSSHMQTCLVCHTQTILQDKVDTGWLYQCGCAQALLVPESVPAIPV